jgi:hypothetical protein
MVRRAAGEVGVAGIQPVPQRVLREEGGVECVDFVAHRHEFGAGVGVASATAAASIHRHQLTYCAEFAKLMMV